MNRSILAAAATAMIALAGCVQTATGPATSAVDPFLGKRLVSDNGNAFIFDSLGNVGGTLRGEPIRGSYTADAREICSTYTAPANLAGLEFCSTPRIDGDMVVFNRRDGTVSVPYRIQG